MVIFLKMFLIDDSLSMGAYWLDVISLFSVLAWIVKKLDDNGLEMYFTVSTVKKHFKDTSKAVILLENMRQYAYSNIDARLQEILRKYQEKLKHHKQQQNSFLRQWSKLKPLSLYVFTDAAWPGCDATIPIEVMIAKLKEFGFAKE